MKLNVYVNLQKSKILENDNNTKYCNIIKKLQFFYQKCFVLKRQNI